MTPPDKKQDLYDADADQPEVLHDEDTMREADELPSQAEGDRETVEENLEEKFDE